MNNQQVSDLLRLAWPIIIIQFGLQIYVIVDILKRKKTKNLNPAVWIIITIIGEILGPILYLLLGRSED